MSKEFQSITEQVDSFRRNYHSIELLKGSLWTSGILLALMLLLFSLEYYLYLPVEWKTTLFYFFIAAALATIYFRLIRPMIRYFNLSAGLTRAEAAKMIGSKLKLDDELTNALQLIQQLDASNRDLSLVEASLNRRDRHFKEYSFPKAIPWSESRKFIRYLAVPVLLLLLMFAVTPSLILDGGSRFVNYSEQFIPEAPFQFVVQNDRLECVQNEDFVVKLRTEGERIPEEVFIEFGGSNYLMKRIGNTEFGFTIKNARQDLPFRFSSGRFYSREFSLKVIPDPRLKNLKIDLKYPAYLGLEAESFSNQANLSVPIGTEITWHLSTENIDSTKIHLPGGVSIGASSTDGRSSFDASATESGEYLLELMNVDNGLIKTLSHSLEVILDRFPEIRVERIGDSASLKEIYFSGLISDDYGLSKMMFYAVKEGSDERFSENILINRQLPNQPLYHYFNLDDFSIRTGQSVRMWFELTDNDAVQGPKTSKSAVFRIEAPSKSALKEKERSSRNEMEASMKQKIDELKDFQKEIAELERRLVEKKQLNWQDKKSLKELLEKQKELEKSMDELKNQNKELNETRNQLTEEDEQLLEKQKKIEALFENLMTEEMRELFEEMEELLEELNKDEVQEKLSEMKMSNEEMEKELDRTLELFKQLEFEKAVQDAIEELDELKKEQEDLGEEKGDNSEKQDELNERFEEFTDDMKELKEKNESLEKPNEMGSDPEQKSNEIMEQMKQSSEDMKQGKKSKGKQGQKQSQEQMQQLQDDLQAMQDMMGQEQAAEDLESLRRLLENLIQLSFDQEELIDELDGISPKDPRFVNLAQRQKKLKDDSKLVADSLYALSKRVVALEATINKEMNEINQKIDRSIDQLSRRRAREAQRDQQFAMTGMNNLALLLDESIQNAQMQMAQSQFGSGKCSKPGNKPSAGSLKQMQQQLNKQMEALKKQLEQQGNKPGGKQRGAGQGGQHAEQFSKLAARQSAIRNELRKLQESLKDGQGSGELNRLEKLMEEAERDLITRQLSLETIKRQEEILTRMLESERAERERYFEEERQAREGKKNEKRNLFDLEEYIQRKEKESELYRTMPPRLCPYYKSKVSEYLNK